MNLISNFLYTLLAIVRKSPRADSEKVEISKVKNQIPKGDGTVSGLKKR